MSKALVIVESPAKAKTINRYLGTNYTVQSCIGHIRDLPVSGQKRATKKKKAPAIPNNMSATEKKHAQLVARMGVDPENGWEAHYEIVPGKEKVVADLKSSAQKASHIYLATDLDREGEAIAWHLQKIIGAPQNKYRRVIFNEITQKAILSAFKNHEKVSIPRVQAQQARRFLDRVVGYMLSPLLWKKVARSLSAGRVQSIAVRLLVEREREMSAFIPEEYWELHVNTHDQKKHKMRLQVKKYKNKPFKPNTEDAVKKAIAHLQSTSYQVHARDDKPETSSPLPPFITSTLQQAASTRLFFGVKKTMMLAQRLYESGHITYMRTDATHLSPESLNQCRLYIEAQYGKNYLPPQANVYRSKKNAQEAHEAIRPSNVKCTPQQIKGLPSDAVRLYTLIRNRFIACQMAKAEYMASAITVKHADYEMRATGRVITFDGYTAVLPATQPKQPTLPDVTAGDTLTLVNFDPSQHFTKGPPRYTEASLVKELEKRNIGRPSTYSSIIQTIQERGYATLHNRRFVAEKIGSIITDRLIENFPDLMDYDFTAKMEMQLDTIAIGDADWQKVLDNFYKHFKSQLDKANNPQGMRPNTPTPVEGIRCPQCQREMHVRTASSGVFLGCSGYNDLPERCKKTINLVAEEEINAETDEVDAAKQKLGKRTCPLCTAQMDAYLMSTSQRLHLCNRNPDCAGYVLEEGKFQLQNVDTIPCDKCSQDMTLQLGRFGKYFSCSSSTCSNTRKVLRNGTPAPPKMDPIPMPELRCSKTDDHFLLRDGISGLFLAASHFPKHRETRAPLVKELLPYHKQVDKKYRFILDAPPTDPKGRATIVRYDRKKQMHYVRSEIDGKPSGWKAEYQAKKWVATQAKTITQKTKRTQKKSKS